MLQFKKVADGVYKAESPLSKYRVESYIGWWTAYRYYGIWSLVGIYSTKEKAENACNEDFNYIRMKNYNK